MNKFYIPLVIALLAAGCGLKAQTYVMTRERTDITPEGNAGFLSGSGTVKEPERKTRKIYVFEVTKAIPESEVKKIEQEVATQTTQHVETPQVSEPPQQASRQLEEQRRIVIPPLDDEETAAAADAEAPIAIEAQEYVIQKDDTLQKIAKKHYGSYGKWIKIYEANKETIKNPNLLKAGTKITLPAQ